MSKFTDKLAQRMFQIESKGEIQVSSWNGECTRIECVPTKIFMFALMDYLDIEYDAKHRMMKLKPTEEE